MTDLNGPSNDRTWAPEVLTVTVLRSDALRASLRIVGELDAVGAVELSAALSEQRGLGRRYIRLDLSGVAFLDSTGMRVLSAEHTAFLRGRGTMIITGLTPRARRLLELVRLDRELLLLEPFAPVTAVAAAV